MAIRSIIRRSTQIWREEDTGQLLKSIYGFLEWKLISQISNILLLYYKMLDWASGRRTSMTLDTTAKYHISSKVEQLPEFEFYFNFNSPHRRARILGDYEVPVARALAEQLDEDTQLWEVGAAWGYHTLAAAGIAEHVVAFEPDDDRRELLSLSRDVNQFDNISTVTQHVDSLDNYIEDYGVPNVIFVDIDGWEYEVIPASKELLSADCIWIVELHHNVDVPPGKNKNPGDIEELFKQYGYEVERIYERGSRNWRGKEQGDLNTHHILARPK